MLLVTTGLMLGPALFALVLSHAGYGASWNGVALMMLLGALLFRLGSRMPATGSHETRAHSNPTPTAAVREQVK
jgi:predicted MFS family arabinose efflux permease